MRNAQDSNWEKVFKESVYYQKEYGLSNTLKVTSFLRWYHPQKKQFITSPLTVAPCSIVKKRKVDVIFDLIEDEDIFVNPTLSKAFEQNYDINLLSFHPEKDGFYQSIIDELSTSDTLIELTTDFSKEEQWQIIIADFLGNFNYRKSTLADDYQRIIEQPTPSIIKLLEGDLLEQNEVANKPVGPLDTSQKKAIANALIRNVSIQGPPGTGKSHTIVQLIYQAVLEGKKVLFVSEKSAALEVVYKQFKKDKTDPLVAFFNAGATEKRDFYKHLAASWEQLKTKVFEYKSDNEKEHPIVKYYLQTYQDGEQSTSRLVERIKKNNSFGLRYQEKLSYPTIADWSENFDFLQSFEERLGESIAESFVVKLNRSLFAEKNPIDTLKKRITEAEKIVQQIREIAIKYDLPQDMDEFVRKAIAASILGMVNKSQLDLLNDQHKSYKSFGNLAKRYELAKAKYDRQTSVNAKWKSKPSKTEITELIDLLKHQHAARGIFGILKRRASSLDKVFEGFDSHLSNKGKIQLLEELRQEWNLKGQVEELKIKLKHQYSIVDPDQEIPFILNLRLKLDEINSTDYLFLLEHPASLSIIEELNAIHKKIQHFTHLLKFTFAGKLPADLNAIDQLLSSCIANIGVLQKLGFMLGEFFQLPSSIIEYLASSKGSLQELDVELCKMQLDLNNKFEPAYYQLSGKSLLKDLEYRRKEIEQLSKQTSLKILSKAQQNLVNIEKLLSTPASKLKQTEKEKKKQLKGEKRIVLHEMNKKRQHMSVKQVEQNCRMYLSAFQNVWMMNPLAVSKFLENYPNLFDLVIFDEASQIPLEDALPAIYRSKQVVVVGDEHQMPPSNYFSTNNDSPTLLTKANNSFTKFMLQWHYRSLNPELIAFSNNYFYEGELKTLPPISLDHAIEFYHHQKVYHEGSNEGEAQLIVEALKKESKLSSCAVIAFSKEQEKTIRAALKRTDLNTEDILIKNLESVQGIERDVVYISVGYGRNNAGKFRMNLGPVNQEFGLNRLNVMFSRAKSKLKVFSSVKSSDFELSDNQGIQCLSDFLRYAETVSNKPIENSKVTSIFGVEVEDVYYFDQDQNCSVPIYIQPSSQKALLIDPTIDEDYDLVNVYGVLKSRFQQLKILLTLEYLKSPEQCQAEIHHFFNRSKTNN